MIDKLYRDLEREKYQRVWSDTRLNYGLQTDGLPAVSQAFRGMGCKSGETLIDWGCGTGRATLCFQKMGLKVTGFDIAHNCLADGIDIPLVVGCMWEAPPNLYSDYGFCTDVLEHIPTDYVQDAIDVVYERSKKAAFIQIDTVPDISGAKMNPPETLHLCIHGGAWWEDQLLKRWRSVECSPGLYTRFRYLCLR